MGADKRENIGPFKIWNNIYYVGTQAVSVHLIDTGAGLIMIDTGFDFMRDTIVGNMRALGYDPVDIRILLHSHGHYDHYANTQYLQSLSGAKTYISRIDNEIVNGHRNLSLAEEAGAAPIPAFDCDVLLEDGDVVELGDTRIKCRLAPGHTEGVLAFFFESGGLRAAMHGGVGLNSMKRAFLEQHSLPLDLPERFRRGLRALREEPVDIVLGNHPDQTDTEGKAARLRAGDARAFVDPGEWPRFLETRERMLDEMLENERAKE